MRPCAHVCLLQQLLVFFGFILFCFSPPPPLFSQETCSPRKQKPEFKNCQVLATREAQRQCPGHGGRGFTFHTSLAASLAVRKHLYCTVSSNCPQPSSLLPVQCLPCLPPALAGAGPSARTADPVSLVQGLGILF